MPAAASQPEVMCRGGSCIVSPLGEVLEGPLWDQEGTKHTQQQSPASPEHKNFHPAAHPFMDMFDD